MLSVERRREGEGRDELTDLLILFFLRGQSGRIRIDYFFSVLGFVRCYFATNFDT